MGLLFALFTTFAASARGCLPPRRAAPESRGHLGERGGSAAVLETFEPAIEVGGGEMKASGQARGLEARRDLLHLADPAPGLARLRGDDLGALRQLGLRAFPFLEQRSLDPFVCRERADRGEKRSRAFAPVRIAGLQRGGRADSTMSATPSGRSSTPRSSSPAALARERVAALRPADAHTTRRPSPPRQAPIAEPISPGWSSATVFIAMGSPPESMSRRDDLDMMAAHVETGRLHDLAVAA